MKARAVTVAAGLGLLLSACSQDEPPGIESAVFVVSLDGCAQNIENRATAVAIDDGLALTVAHSFDEVDGVTLLAPDGSELPAQLVYIDVERDIALLAYEAPVGSIDTLDIRDDSDDPAEQARIVVERDDRIVVDTVRLVRRTEVTLDGAGRRNGIEIEGIIDPGDSGAPVVDDQGRIIGIVFASTRASDTGWAVAGSELVDIASLAGAPITLTC